VPVKPDLAIAGSDLTLSNATPTPNDSALTIKLKVSNYGLVPPDSVMLSLSDAYGGNTYPLVSDLRLPPTRHRDSVVIGWDPSSQVGRHTLVATVDPGNVINEVNELNNIVSVNQFVYANLIAAVKPLDNAVMPAGPQTLVVTSPLGMDSVGFVYYFELDTLPTFDSPFKISSGLVAPGPVSGQWATPSLAINQVYFWRARTVDGKNVGNWLTASFSTSSDLPLPGRIRWKESSQAQFAREVNIGTAPTDSGVTILPNLPINLSARSVGNRANPDLDYYSTIQINETLIRGYWWHIGYSFMVLRVNEFDGSYIFRPFNVRNVPADADSMVKFITNTPVGNFLAISVVYDGRTNVTESLYVAIESLGSTLIRQAQNGQSWALIGRKGVGGPGMAPLEGLTNDSVLVDLEIPAYYSLGKGSITSKGITMPTSWDSLFWRREYVPGVSNVSVAVLGVRGNNRVDTLRFLPPDITDVDLGFLNALTSGPTYTHVRTAALLSSTDALVTPRLTSWWVDFIPPADLAVSSRTVGIPDVMLERGLVLNLPVTVHNIGFSGIDSARITVSVFDKVNRARAIAWGQVDTIPVDGSSSTIIPISTSDFPRRVTLQVSVAPSKKYKDLVPENNVAYYTFTVAGSLSAPVQMYADGAHLMDGDYVAAKPTILIRAPARGNDEPRSQNVALFVNGKNIPQSGTAGGDAQFNPELPDGHHQVSARLSRVNSFGEIDTVERTITVSVLNELRILQLYNYPNPFRQETHFTFMLTGSRPPEDLTIRIFTIAGRKVREIRRSLGELQVGFNRVYWDGRDADGDEVANGYYLYQVSLRGAGETVSAIEKLVKVR